MKGTLPGSYDISSQVSESPDSGEIYTTVKFKLDDDEIEMLKANGGHFHITFPHFGMPHIMPTVQTPEEIGLRALPGHRVQELLNGQ